MLVIFVWKNAQLSSPQCATCNIKMFVHSYNSQSKDQFCESSHVSYAFAQSDICVKRWRVRKVHSFQGYARYSMPIRVHHMGKNGPSSTCDQSRFRSVCASSLSDYGLWSLYRQKRKTLAMMHEFTLVKSSRFANHITTLWRSAAYMMALMGQCRHRNQRDLHYSSIKLHLYSCCREKCVRLSKAQISLFQNEIRFCFYLFKMPPPNK